MNTLTEKELEELMISTGTYKEGASENEKAQWKDAYRKVEAETNQQIKNAGGIKNWYERGRC